jgi:transcriptional regulator with XRE-family HTH domain
MKKRPVQILGSKKFGNYLVMLREGMPAQLAAAKCGVTPQLWSHYETGHRRPGVDALYAMSELFGVDMAKLYETCCPAAAAAAKSRIAA